MGVALMKHHAKKVTETVIATVIVQLDLSVVKTTALGATKIVV